MNLLADVLSVYKQDNVMHLDFEDFQLVHHLTDAVNTLHKKV